MLVCLVVLALGLLLVALRGLRAERMALRACPVCAAVAVRASDAEELDGGRVRLQLQCGQCGTWRRALASASDIAAYGRALQRDQRRLGDEAFRLVRLRLRRDLAAFSRTLRWDVVGAEDFLARARCTLPRGRGL